MNTVDLNQLMELINAMHVAIHLKPKKLIVIEVIGDKVRQTAPHKETYLNTG